MSEKNTELMDAILSGEDDPILPDGWQEGDDLFAEVVGDEDSFVTDGSREEIELPAENENGNSEEADPTTVGADEEESHGDEIGDGSEAPDGENQSQNRSRKLKLKVNHREEEVDIDAMSDDDLIAALQKSRKYEMMKETEAKQKYQQIYQEQLDAGMTEAAAKLIAQNESGGKTYSLVDEEPSAESVTPEVKSTDAVRDFRSEMEQLQALYPEFKEMPDEVARAAAKGVPLLTAYLAYREKQSAKTAATLQKENRVLKQNAASAAKAPVRGVSGGGVEPKKVDNFLKGFDSDPW